MTDDALIAAIQHYTMLKHDALERLARAVSDITVPGAIVECGVASGGTAAFLWALTGRNRHLWMFDSWQGLPAPDSATDGGRAVSKHIHRMLSYGGAWCRGEIVDVIRALLAVECPLELQHYAPGWFDETLPERAADIGPIAVLHIDGDFYASTALPLRYLWPHVVSGGVVICDDYDAWQGCKRAVDEFCQDNGLSLDEQMRIVKP